MSDHEGRCYITTTKCFYPPDIRAREGFRGKRTKSKKRKININKVEVVFLRPNYYREKDIGQEVEKYADFISGPGHFDRIFDSPNVF